MAKTLAKMDEKVNFKGGKGHNDKESKENAC